MSKTRLEDLPPIGDRKRTLWKKRVVICCGHDLQCLKVRFYFEDEGPKPFHQQCTPRTWATWADA